MKQQSPEWFKARTGRITASLVGALLDCAPYMSKDSAFRSLVRSMHDMPNEFEGNIATEYGNANEALARSAYEMQTGNTVEAVGFVPFAEWAGASPDGLLAGDGLLEIKCPFGKRKDNPPEFASIEDQPHYYAQVQFQIFCTMREWCDFWQWSPHGHKLERVMRDTQWQQENIPALLNMWHDAKAADPADYSGPLRQIIDTPEAARLIAEYDELRDAIDNAKERQADIFARFEEMSGGANADIAGRKFTLVKRAGSVSYAKAIADLLPDADLEPYRGKPSQSWKLT